MHLFGLTGGIASGKSAAAAQLRRRDVPVVDADELARRAVEPGTDGLRAIVEAFGAGVLLADGALDRKALAALVFADPERRKLLNAITHPRIAALGSEQVQDLTARGEPLACYEAALLVENGLQDAFRPLVVVAVPKHVQIARTKARDGCTGAEAEARVAAQMPLEEKIRVADFVIDNEGSIEELGRNVDEILRAVCKQIGVPEARYFTP